MPRPQTVVFVLFLLPVFGLAGSMFLDQGWQLPMLGLALVPAGVAAIGYGRGRRHR